MSRPARTPDAAPVEDPEEASPALEAAPAVEASGPAIRADFRDLPVLGFSRRRVGFALGAVVAAWVLIVFARQVGEASAATARAASMAAENQILAAHVGALERELVRIQDPRYVAQQARAHRMGNGREIPFQLAADAPPLPPDAPGSASVRVGADVDRATPLEAWLDLLFGPSG